MLVFLFTDIEGSTRLWEEHTDDMGTVIARHDALLRQLIEGHGGTITKYTGDGITAAFQGGEPVACALAAQMRFSQEPWGPIGELPIRAGLHAGAAEWLAGPAPASGDYHGPPVNCTARLMSAAWGGQILLTPEVTDISPLPPQASLRDLGEHLLKNVTVPQQLYQLLHPQLPRHDFPPPRTLSGQSIRQAVDVRGRQLAGQEPQAMGIALLSATLLPALQGELDPGSGALEGNLGVLEELGALSLQGFVAGFAERLRAGEPLPPGEVLALLQSELRAQWQAGGEKAVALRADASCLLQAVHGVEAAMTAAAEEVKEALARGLAELGGQFSEFRWMVAGVQETLDRVREGQRIQVALQLEQAAMQQEQLKLQQEQADRTEEILRLQREQRPVPRGQRPTPAKVDRLEIARPPAFLETDEEWCHPPAFVARERELARLEGFLERARAGQGRVVFVTGGPGRGKTALLDEFARRGMAAQPDLLVASGSCNAFSGIGDPYLPFRDLMGMLSGDVEAKWAAGAISRDHALRLWGALPRAVQALLDHGPHVVPALLPGAVLLSRAMAVAPAGAPWLQRLRERIERQPAGSEGLEQTHLYQQVTNLLRAMAEAQPLLLIVDDLQWADSASLGLLFHLGRRLEGSRILLAGTYRPEEVALGRRGEQHPLERALAEFKRTFGDVWLDLGGVQAPEGRHFVATLLETEPNRLGEGFRRALFKHTGGHPLFTVEMLRAMQARGDLVRDGTGRWVVGPALDWQTLPARVEGVIEARIGRLDEELRELLSVASVEGETFTAQVVARVQEIDERRALRCLSRELEKRHRLVREQSALRVGRRRLSHYRFAHALFQQYLYNELGDGERALLHREIAAVLEELYEGRLEEVAVALARHFSEADDKGRALKYFTLTGDGALDSYAHAEAEGHYRRALELAPDESEQAHLLSGLGEALLGQSRFQEAIETWRRGIELYRALDDRDGLARLYARSAWAANQAGEPAEDLRLGLEGLAILEGGPDSHGLARLLNGVARAHCFKAQREQARPFAQRALAMAERLGDVEVQAQALASLGGYALLSSVDDDLEALAKAVELAESSGLLAAASRAHNNLGVHLAISLGDYSTARQHYRRAAELSEQVGHTVRQIFVLCNLAHVLMLCGDFEEVETTLSGIRALLSDLTEPSLAAESVLESEMWYAGYRGEWIQAARLARAQQASVRERGSDLYLADAGLWLGRSVLESHRFFGGATASDWEEAGTALAEAIEIYDRSTYISLGMEARVWFGSLCLAQGGLGDARRLLAEAREKATARPGVLDEAFLQLLAAQIAGAEGRWAEALAAFEAAAGVHARFGMRWYWARWLLDWAEAHVARGEPGDRERARQLLREAQATFEEMGIPRYAAIARDALEALEAKDE